MESSKRLPRGDDLVRALRLLNEACDLTGGAATRERDRLLAEALTLLRRGDAREPLEPLTVPHDTESIADALLGRPSRRLISYGTLRPGRSNSIELADLVGEWTPCFIRGRIFRRDGLDFFRWDPAGTVVEAMLFTSDGLPAAWERLDRFEGADYRRRLVPAKTAEGEDVVGQVYEQRAT